MVWSWSHSIEAYRDLEQSIAAQPREWLEVVFAEWKASTRGAFHPRPSFSIDFDERRFDRALGAAKHLSSEALAERIYAWAERQGTCDNGGFEAWCCPHGCACHALAWDAYKHATKSLFRRMYKSHVREASGRTAFAGLELRDAWEAFEENAGDAIDWASPDESLIATWLEEKYSSARVVAR